MSAENDSPMTPASRMAYLVEKGMEAFGPDLWGSATYNYLVNTVGHERAAEYAAVFNGRLRERMAQAAQVWTCEINELEEALRDAKAEAAHYEAEFAALRERYEGAY